MTKPTTIKFGKMVVKIESKDSPAVYVAPCGFTTKAFNRTKNLNEVNVPDCDDPDAPAWVERDVASLSWSITGQGVLAQEARDTWDAAFESTDPVNVQVEFTWPDGTTLYSGAAHLETFEITSELGQRVLANISIQGDGALTRTPLST